MTICGAVTNEHFAASSKGKPTFIDLDSAFPQSVFVVVVWEENRQEVGLLPAVKDHLCATGVISYYRGIPQIIVRKSSQLTR